jgi:hypothetical protein
MTKVDEYVEPPNSDSNDVLFDPEELRVIHNALNSFL